MLVTLTSKGQLTLPKRIRDELKLDAGSKLDFSIQPDGSLTARPLHRSVSAIVGLLHRPGRAAATIEQLNDARDAYLADKHSRVVMASAGRKRVPGA
jgi:antitoxin PrlF